MQKPGREQQQQQKVNSRVRFADSLNKKCSAKKAETLRHTAESLKVLLKQG
jgi:hypothetical protein